MRLHICRVSSISGTPQWLPEQQAPAPYPQAAVAAVMWPGLPPAPALPGVPAALLGNGGGGDEAAASQRLLYRIRTAASEAHERSVAIVH